MKNYRKILPIVLAFLMVLSWYMLISDTVQKERDFRSYLNVAREKAAVGITVLAVDNYKKALEIKDDPDIYVEVADYYKNIGDSYKYIDWCENFYESYPTEPKAVDCVLEAYLTDQDYESCFDVITVAAKRNIKTKYLAETENQLRYLYELDYTGYDDVADMFTGNRSAVNIEGKWGYVDMFGNKAVSCQFVEAGPYIQSDYAPVKAENGEAFFIDLEGNKILATKEAFEIFGGYSNDLIPAKQANGKYTYVDESFKSVFGEYDYASTMYDGVAAVLNGTEWQIIDEKGKNKAKQSFQEIVIDQRGIAYLNERLFVKQGDGQIIMVDSSGNQVGTQSFEEAKLFASESYAAVKVDGKWGFVDKKGTMQIEPQFDEARSFKNGLAAVRVQDKWGFIDEEGTICIEPAFDSAKDFNAKGGCFVKNGDQWNLLKIYRLNRED